MGLTDVLGEITGEKKEKGKASVRYVSFQLKEWEEMETKFGKKIDPADVKKMVQGIFSGRFTISAVKKSA